MKRPLLIVAISYVVGIIIGVYLQKSILFILLISIVCMIFIKNKKILQILVISLFVMTISFCRVQYLNKNYQKFYLLDEKEVQLIGTVCSQIKETDYNYVVTVKLNSKYKNAKILMYINKEIDLKKLEFGNKIAIKGKYTEPSDSRNYKGYSYKEYLKTTGIYGTLEVEGEVTLIKTKNLNIILRLINQLSCEFKQNLDKLLTEKVAGLAKGILLGDSSSISNDIKENFQKCNLSHVLAVSGDHLSYVVLGINLLLNKKIFGLRNCKIICIVLIIIFMIIVNMSPSVVRAGISTIIIISSSLIYRKQDTYTTMSIALLSSLVTNPFSLFNIGLQLSYLATLGIIMFYSKFVKKNDKKNKIKKYILNSIMLTFSANILILPLIIYNFNILPLNSVISNFFTGPLMGIITILGLFTLLLSIIFFPISKIFAFPLELLFQLLIKITEIIAKIPLGNYIVVTPYLVSIILCYIAIFTYLNNKKIITKILIIILILIFISSQILGFVNIDKKLKLYFVDVGQGDSCLIKSPEGKNILIDGGGSRDSEKYDIGEKTLVPYLLDRRIKVLDYIMVSHFDADHAQGLEAVLQKIKVKNIIVSKQPSNSTQYEEIMRLCYKYKVNVKIVKRGDILVIDKYMFFEIFHPGDIMLDDGKGGLNANAIVAKLYYRLSDKQKKYFTILFTGDIEKDAENELVKLYENKLKSDILKIAHHGSKTSSTAEFLEAVNPSIGLIGVGEDNNFGHPNEAVLERIESLRY